MTDRVLIATIAVLLVSLPLPSQASTDGVRARQSAVSDGPVKITARIDKGTARVAEPIQFTLEVEAPRGARIEMPGKVDRLGDFEVRRSEQNNDIPSAAGAEKRTWILRATLETLKTGELSISPLEVHYTRDLNSST